MIKTQIEWIKCGENCYRCSACETTVYVCENEDLPTYCKMCEGEYPE
jgi:hypothetical protein